MAVPIRHPLRLLAILLALAIGHAPAAADDRSEFRTAMEQASVQYHIALRTLEVDGREQTATEVRRFRQAWQDIVERSGKTPPFAADDAYAATLMEVDVRLLGALLVIDLGSRDAAREALKPVGATLEQLWGRAGPQP